MFLSLGQHPPSDSFLKPEQIASERRYPLEVYFCESCALVQLLDVVPAEEIFDDYVYLASSPRRSRTIMRSSPRRRRRDSAWRRGMSWSTSGATTASCSGVINSLV